MAMAPAWGLKGREKGFVACRNRCLNCILEGWIRDAMGILANVGPGAIIRGIWVELCLSHLRHRELLF